VLQVQVLVLDLVVQVLDQVLEVQVQVLTLVLDPVLEEGQVELITTTTITIMEDLVALGVLEVEVIITSTTTTMEVLGHNQELDLGETTIIISMENNFLHTIWNK